MIMMSFTLIRRFLSASFIRSFWQNISDYFKRKLASGSRNVNVNEVAIIVSEVKYFAFLVYSKIKGRVDLSSGSTLFWANGTHTDSLNALIKSFRLYILGVYNCIVLCTYMIVCRIDMQLEI